MCEVFIAPGSSMLRVEHRKAVGAVGLLKNENRNDLLGVRSRKMWRFTRRAVESELFAEETGYFVVIGDLAVVVEGVWLIGGDVRLFVRHLSDELPELSNVLRLLAGLCYIPPPLYYGR